MGPRGVGRMDIVALLLILAIAVLIITTMIPMAGRARIHPAFVKERTQLREITSAISNLSSATDAPFPLPMLSARDGANQDWSLNTTARIDSMLIGMQLLRSWVFVSPGELNPSIRPFGDYIDGNYVPTGMSEQGPWFDGFSADLALQSGCNTSFAHMEPTQDRVQRLRDEGDARFPLVSLRFPKVTETRVESRGAIVTPFANARSYPVRMCKPAHQWIGNVGYADGHVDLVHSWLKRGVTDSADIPWTYQTTAGQPTPDLPWLDETEDAVGVNHFLGIFIEAGRERGDFVAVYD